MVAHGEHRETEDLETDERRHRPVDPLDPGLRVVCRRQELAVAERPVGTAKPRVRRAHDHPDRDQPEGGRQGQQRELLEAVHGPPF
jgi:hypothetical protein